MRTFRAALLAALVVAAAGCYGGYVSAGYSWPGYYSSYGYYGGYAYAPYYRYGYGAGPYRYGYYAPYRYGYAPYRYYQPYRGTTVRPYYPHHGGGRYYAPRGYYGYRRY